MRLRLPARPHLTVLVLVFTMSLSACQPSGEDRSERTPPAVGVDDVVARNLQFRPPAVQVTPGTTITWHFEDGTVPHDVKADGFYSGIQKTGTFEHRFDQPGTYSYRCTLHAGMTGRVVVAGQPRSG
jgi:plastocyanin